MRLIILVLFWVALALTACAESDRSIPNGLEQPSLFISVDLPNGNQLVAPILSYNYYESQDTLQWADAQHRGFFIYHKAPPHSLKADDKPNDVWEQIDEALNKAPEGHVCTKYAVILVSRDGGLKVLPSISAPYTDFEGYAYYSSYERGEFQYEPVPTADLFIIVDNTPCVWHSMLTDTEWYCLRWGRHEDLEAFLYILEITLPEEYDDLKQYLVKLWSHKSPF